jgi:hypothetical protein
MSDDKADPTAISRRTLLGAASAAPLVCTVAGDTPPAEDSLVGRCAQWLSAEFEADALARRWAALEILAASGYDYFRMNDRERRDLPMAPEMAAIETKLDDLWEIQKGHFHAVAKMEPKTIHEAVSLLVITARIDARDEGPTGPLIRRTMAFFAKATCPGCGAPYVPASLPSA